MSQSEDSYDEMPPLEPTPPIAPHLLIHRTPKEYNDTLTHVFTDEAIQNNPILGRFRTVDFNSFAGHGVE